MLCPAKAKITPLVFQIWVKFTASCIICCLCFSSLTHRIQKSVLSKTKPKLYLRYISPFRNHSAPGRISNLATDPDLRKTWDERKLPIPLPTSNILQIIYIVYLFIPLVLMFLSKIMIKSFSFFQKVTVNFKIYRLDSLTAVKNMVKK